MKKIRNLVLVVLAVFLSFALVACGGDPITVNIKEESFEILDNETVQVEIEVSKEGVELVYESSNPSVAKFTDGQLIGVGAGEATIKVYVKDSPESADTAAVVVEAYIPLAVEIEEDEYVVEAGKSIDVKVETSKEAKLVYESSDPAVATFENGKLTGVSKGETFIKVYAEEDPTVCDTAKVVVKVLMSLDATFEYSQTMDKNTSQTIAITMVEDSENAIVSYTAANEFATVDKNGNVTAVKTGTAVINVKLFDPEEPTNEKTYTLEIVVEETEFVIEYDLGGFEIDVELVEQYTKGDAFELPVLEVKNFIFLGWFLNDEAITGITADMKGDLVIVAKFEENLEGPFEVTYDLQKGYLTGGYTSVEQVGEEFLADFNKYGDGSVVTKENFQNESHPCVKTSLANAEMLAKWKWLWSYMLVHLQEFNTGQTSSYIVDTYPILQKMINGDTNAILESANARTSIRSYMHGLMNLMKGCGDANVDFAKYSPDFSLSEVREEFLKNQYELNVILEEGAALPSPIRDGYTFVGWQNQKGQMITVASCHGVYTAIWEEKNPVTSIEITNKVEEINQYETYQLEWALNPSDAGEKAVKFESDNEEVATISEEGFITTYKVGTVTFTITSLSKHGHTDTMTVNVVTPGYFEISYETNSYVVEGEEIQLNAVYVNSKNEEVAVEWSSLDETLATVDENGIVYGVAAGKATIRATVKGDATAYQDFVVTVITTETSEALSFILNAHESNIFTSYNLGIGSGTPAYYSDILGSVSKLLFNEELVIDTTYNKKTNDKYGADLANRVMESIEFITVHYTGGMGTGSTGEANAEWFSQSLADNNTSIHYTTGNDGVFKGLDEQYRAAHAGDSSGYDIYGKFEWLSTGVTAPETYTAEDLMNIKVTVSDDCYYEINGQKTNIPLPEAYDYSNRGSKHTYNDKGQVVNAIDGSVRDAEEYFNMQGFRFIVEDGEYKMSKTWWCYTQVWEGRISNLGGNNNSIGIESAVNKGSDLWYTWQRTAQLVADIMVRNNLDINRVVGHHFFSAKDCPQPMLENDMEIWYEFIELVKVEYDRITKFADYEITFEVDSDLVKDNGRVSGAALTSQVVTYKVTISDGTNSETIELATIIEGQYCR